MTDGLVLQPGAGRRIQGASMTLKVGAGQSAAWSAFEAEVTPGFDVGAHLHHHAEELFYILDGELDLLAFEPQIRTSGDWRSWESASGMRVMRGGPGSTMFVPAGCPHAFANRGTGPARMLFLVSPPGHERYLEEIGELIGQPGPPDPAAIVKCGPGTTSSSSPRWPLGPHVNQAAGSPRCYASFAMGTGRHSRWI